MANKRLKPQKNTCIEFNFKKIDLKKLIKKNYMFRN